MIFVLGASGVVRGADAEPVPVLCGKILDSTMTCREYRGDFPIDTVTCEDTGSCTKGKCIKDKNMPLLYARTLNDDMDEKYKISFDDTVDGPKVKSTPKPCFTTFACNTICEVIGSKLQCVPLKQPTSVTLLYHYEKDGECPPQPPVVDPPVVDPPVVEAPVVEAP